jgi:putative hemolysin
MWDIYPRSQERHLNRKVTAFFYSFILDRLMTIDLQLSIRATGTTRVQEILTGTMPSITTELFIIFLLIFVNGIFAMAEISIVSSRKARLEQWSKEGNEGARAALELANAPNTFLATIQIGMTVTSMLTGVFSGATIAETFAQLLGTIPVLKPYASAIGLGTVVVAISFLTLILGELSPKRIGLSRAERLACIVGPPMLALSRLGAPVIRLLNWFTDLVVKALGIKESHEPPVTTDEINLMIEHGTDAGVFEESEEEMVRSVLRLGARPVTALMTPRPRLICVDVNDNHQQILTVLAASPPTRLLVIDGDVENILGYVFTKQVLAQPVFSNPVDLKACLKQPLFVPETKTALQVLEMFKRTGTHIAVILDEYGEVKGVATMTDMLRAIIGETDLTETPLKAALHTECCWLLDGFLPIDQLKEMISVQKLPDEETVHYHTLAGFIMHQIGHVPEVSNQFEWQGIRFYVSRMKGRRIDKIGVTLVNEENAVLKKVETLKEATYVGRN